MAEVNLSLVAAPGILETDRLAALGLALRAFLCLEVRHVRLLATAPVMETPQHIVANTTVVRATVETVSGAQFAVVIGVPAAVRLWSLSIAL